MENAELNLRRPRRSLGLPGNALVWRLIRALQKSPLFRLIVVAIVFVTGRSSFLRFRVERHAWGTSVVAAQLIHPVEEGHVLRAEDVRWISLPRIAVSASAATEKSQLLGKRITRAGDTGEVLSRLHVADSTASRLRVRTGPGRFAVPISLRDVSPVAKVGDDVDVIDSSGRVVAVRAQVMQVMDRQVTVSISAGEVSVVSVALNGPVVLAVRGEDVS